MKGFVEYNCREGIFFLGGIIIIWAYGSFLLWNIKGYLSEF